MLDGGLGSERRWLVQGTSASASAARTVRRSTLVRARLEPSVGTMAATKTRKPAKRPAAVTPAQDQARVQAPEAPKPLGGSNAGYVAHLLGVTRSDLAAVGIR